ncbi:MAG TPA: alpha/beta fold hydrolase [Candidatus Dormibacteraeota bacterium]|nr:alpha/beta fold hydrolase [Candidatus Dormibacteraeota bacterium]
MRWLAGLAALALTGAACTSGSTVARSPANGPSERALAPSTTGPSPAAVAPIPSPTPQLAPYYIESLRARPYPGGKLQLGDVMFRAAGFTKYYMSWPSGGQTMTGTISLPDGNGPFPVVVVNHGFIPPDRYWVGQDSGIFGDPMAAHGFISVAPNWPGYAGSGPGSADLPQIVGELVTALDLVSSLSSLAQADMGKIAFVGHSNGGGISQLAMVVDPRIKAVVLHGPVSSDMADNARKWWLQRPESLGSLGAPESNPEGYRHLSPRNYFETGQPPVLIIQGTVDHTIPAEWTNLTYAALQQKGIESRLTWFDGADHDFVGANLDNAVSAQEAWVRHVLKM